MTFSLEFWGSVEHKLQGEAEQVFYGGSLERGSTVLYSVIMKETLRFPCIFCRCAGMCPLTTGV